MKTSTRRIGGLSFSRGWRRLTRVWRRDTVANIDDELRFHFDEKIAELEAAGLSASDARTRALEEFGDEAQIREALLQIDNRVAKRLRRADWWESVVQDGRYVLRSLARSPLFTATVIITLALGLGANAAIFSLLDRLYLQPPAGVADVNDVRRVYLNSRRTSTHYVRASYNYPEVREMRAVAPTGVLIAGYEINKSSLDRDVGAPTVNVTSLEGDYFAVVGNRPALGRYFSPDEYRIEGQSLVAIVSYDLWKGKYAGDSSIIGRTIEVGSHRHTVIGVSGKDFRGFAQSVSDVWIPLNTIGTLRDRNPAWFESKSRIATQVVARIANEGVTSVFDARATDVIRRISRYPDTSSTIYLGNVVEARGGEGSETELAISTRLGGFAAIILCIAIANVINLLLARATTRRREIALRIALGVTRKRLFLQQAIESGILAILSSFVALMVAVVATRTLRALMMPTVQWPDAVIDTRLVAFTIGLSVFTGIIACIVPAWQTTAPDVSGMLKNGLRDGGPRRSRLRSTLIVAQAAFSVVSLAGAGLFVRSLNSVEAIDVGFDSNRLAFAEIHFDGERGDYSTELRRRMPEVMETLQRIPGVESVARAGSIPMQGMAWTSLFLPGRDSLPPANGVEQILSAVSPGYFNTVGMTVLRGREFLDSDRQNGELVMAMNEMMAKYLWPGEDPLTKCVILHKRTEPCRRVVAIVSPAHYDAVIEKPSMMYYLPLAQQGLSGQNGEEAMGPFMPHTVVLRTAPDRATDVSVEARKQVRALLGDWSRIRVSTMDEVVSGDLQRWRVGAMLFSTAGLLALLVAAVGVYSSVAYTISQRTREMGVRVALGASTKAIVRLVVREGVQIVAIGVTVGLIAALSLGKFVASLLYETSPRDPMVLTGSTLVLLIVAVIACSFPAWRAARIDPLEALKAE